MSTPPACHRSGRRAAASTRQVDDAVGALVNVRQTLPELFRAKPALLAMSPLPSDQMRALASELGVDGS